MAVTVGSLVQARGREWVVLPDSSEDLLMLKPLGGRDEEVTGILPGLETISPASFDLPDPSKPGDFRSARLLREAARLGFRGSAGPFRSFGRIAVEPRHYQLVPLLVALKQDPVRILIADDVGIGKTVEGCLVARELLDRGEASRLAVLCPPHLAEQWQQELREKFNIDAELLLPSTVRKLEGQCLGESVFRRFPHLIISIDFIKSDRYRYDFVRDGAELIIVDEAHTCAFGQEQGRAKQQRHELVKALSQHDGRHLILVTATPHSGKDEAFRSLLGLLNDEFLNFPPDLGGEANRKNRERLAQFFVQRRRADIRHFLQENTPFPDREERELDYQLTPDYRQLFKRALDFVRESVTEEHGDRRRQRVRWWSALALLRSLASSPAAAASTLRSRAKVADAETPEDAEELGRHAVMDLTDDEPEELMDAVPGADPTSGTADEDEETQRVRRRLLEMARSADKLHGAADAKLQQMIRTVRGLVGEGYNPILFCRFIPTAEYLAEHLRQSLTGALRGVEVTAVTGLLPPAERERRVAELAEADTRVLVATDCLSEGINLQDHFDAVVHYDLSWNPTRHEQREGRVDRYGQPTKVVRVLTYYGSDNLIDGRVLDVLINKHNKIRKALGVSVPVPADSAKVMEAIMNAVIESGFEPGQKQLALPGLELERDELHAEWENVSERESRSRTLFAQETIKPDAVAHELQAVQAAIGRGADVRWFLTEAVRAYGGTVAGGDTVKVDPRELPLVVRDLMPCADTFEARFELPVAGHQIYLNRAHPAIEGLASFVLESALDAGEKTVARRAGVIRTGAVARRTTLLLVRLRFALKTHRGGQAHEALAEDLRLLAFEGAPDSAQWLDETAAEALLTAQPEGNVAAGQAESFLRKVIDGFDALLPALVEAANARAEALLESHIRVREASRAGGRRPIVAPFLPVDVLGLYVYLPA
jgi:superfamily II DNA or RNA helicase